jgi:hypothetical protein
MKLTTKLAIGELPKLIQFQVCKPWSSGGDYAIFALGDNNIIYVWHYDNVNKGWLPVTNNVGLEI